MRSNALTVMLQNRLWRQTIGTAEKGGNFILHQLRDRSSSPSLHCSNSTMVRVGKYDSCTEYIQTYRAQGIAYFH